VISFLCDIGFYYLRLLGETAVPRGKSRLEKNSEGSSNDVAAQLKNFDENTQSL
jgi:hypothetical protein